MKTTEETRLLCDFCNLGEYWDQQDDFLKADVKFYTIDLPYVYAYNENSETPDSIFSFSEHEGYALLHKTMGERQLWMKFYASRFEVVMGSEANELQCLLYGCQFHENPDPAQKSDLIAEWLTIKEDE